MLPSALAPAGVDTARQARATALWRPGFAAGPTSAPVGEEVGLLRLALHRQVVRELALEALRALAVPVELTHNGLGVHACGAGAAPRRQADAGRVQTQRASRGHPAASRGAAADPSGCAPQQATPSPTGTLGCLMAVANSDASSFCRSSSAFFLSCRGRAELGVARGLNPGSTPGVPPPMLCPVAPPAARPLSARFRQSAAGSPRCCPWHPPCGRAHPGAGCAAAARSSAAAAHTSAPWHSCPCSSGQTSCPPQSSPWPSAWPCPAGQ